MGSPAMALRLMCAAERNTPRGDLISASMRAVALCAVLTLLTIGSLCSGQSLTIIPELDLVIAVLRSCYETHAVLGTDRIIEDYILAAIQDAE